MCFKELPIEFDEQGQVTGGIGIIEDVTEQRRM